MIAFASAVDALEWCLIVQEAMMEVSSTAAHLTGVWSSAWEL